MALCSKNDVTMRAWGEGGGSKGPKTRVCTKLMPPKANFPLLNRQHKMFLSISSIGVALWFFYSQNHNFCIVVKPIL